MSRYNSVCLAIELLEMVNRLQSGGGATHQTAEEVIGDLQAIAKDVRYGGKWDGDFETVAKALEYCTEPGTNCVLCAYRGRDPRHQCIQEVKTDAAGAIRALSKMVRNMEDQLDGKTVINMDIPQNCLACPFLDGVQGSCVAKEAETKKTGSGETCIVPRENAGGPGACGKPAWCPLTSIKRGF